MLARADTDPADHICAYLSLSQHHVEVTQTVVLVRLVTGVSVSGERADRRTCYLSRGSNESEPRLLRVSEATLMLRVFGSYKEAMFSTPLELNCTSIADCPSTLGACW